MPQLICNAGNSIVRISISPAKLHFENPRGYSDSKTSFVYIMCPWISKWVSSRVDHRYCDVTERILTYLSTFTTIFCVLLYSNGMHSLCFQSQQRKITQCSALELAGIGQRSCTTRSSHPVIVLYLSLAPSQAQFRIWL